MKNDYDMGCSPKTTKVQAIQQTLRMIFELPDDRAEIGLSRLEHLLQCADTLDIGEYLGECEGVARIARHGADKWDVYFMVQVVRHYEQIQTKRAIEKLNQLQQG